MKIEIVFMMIFNTGLDFSKVRPDFYTKKRRSDGSATAFGPCLHSNCDLMHDMNTWSNKCLQLR